MKTFFFRNLMWKIFRSGNAMVARNLVLKATSKYSSNPTRVLLARIGDLALGSVENCREILDVLRERLEHCRHPVNVQRTLLILSYLIHLDDPVVTKECKVLNLVMHDFVEWCAIREIQTSRDFRRAYDVSVHLNGNLKKQSCHTAKKAYTAFKWKNSNVDEEETIRSELIHGIPEKPRRGVKNQAVPPVPKSISDLNFNYIDAAISGLVKKSNLAASTRRKLSDREGRSPEQM